MSGVVFAGFEAVFAEVEVVTVPAFEPGAVYWEHLTAITPADGRRLAFEQHAGVQRYCERVEKNF